MTGTTDTIVYEQVSWMQPITDVKSNKKYLMLGIVRGVKDTFAVTPADGNGETLFYCNKHGIAYKAKEFCIDCRMQVVGEPTE